MASNSIRSIKLYDDSVIKLSVNQGLEEQRTAEVLGNFTNGELAFTRDTARLFVGDNSDGEVGHRGLQETIGGSLVGNKYLGLIDSKPLVTFNNNGEPLSFEETTTYTGTQELEEMQEPGLLVEGSKFRLRSQEGADEKWDNWDRTAVYNPKYNAYNGDFMYDLYQNALILFDTRISGDKESPTQPQIKMEDNDLPSSPETFIVDGKEVSSNSPEALTLTRRTLLRNYAKENEDITNSNMIYGDGYVILRMVEPDNQTVRFKRKAFQENGLPEEENNYSHNILEVFHVSTDAISGNFSDDFYVSGDIIYLDKNLQNVQSVMGEGGKLKLPGEICFATPKSGERGATTYMQWSFKDPTNIDFPTDNKYKLSLVPTEKLTEDGKSYLKFNASVEEEKPYAYTINLDGGLKSDQLNPNTLVIDEQATNQDVTACPTLYLEEPEPDPILFDEEEDPYLTNLSTGDTYYTNNLGVDLYGNIKHIDSFDPTYYGTAKDRIEKWEEENTSINYLKTPVTIAQSCTDSGLYGEIKEPQEEQYTVSNTTSTNGSEAINGDIEKLIKLVDSENKLVYANEKNGTGSSETNNTPTFNSNKLTIPKISKTNGIAIAFSGKKLDVKSYLKRAIIKGKVMGLGGHQGSCKLFAALVTKPDNNGEVEIIKLQDGEKVFNNFTFGFSLETEEVLVSGTPYLVTGLICTPDEKTEEEEEEITEVTVEYTNLSILQTKSLSEENILQLSDIGVNVMLDFNVSPYVYCAKKIVSSPNANILPSVASNGDTTIDWPGIPMTKYFEKFTNGSTGNDVKKTHVKTWNDLFVVLGHNHYDNNKNTNSSTIIKDETKTSVKKCAFKSFIGFDYNDETKKIEKHEEVEAGLEEFIAFSWYKQYKKGTGDVEEEVTYYPSDEFELRSDEFITKYGKNISSIKIDGSDTNLINGSSTQSGVIEGTEEEVPPTSDSDEQYYRKQYVIFSESELIKGRKTFIEYETPIAEDDDELDVKSVKTIYDFKSKRDYSENYQIYIEDDTKKIVFVKNEGENQSKEIDLSTTGSGDIKKKSYLSADTKIETNGKVGDYDYVVFVYDLQIPEDQIVVPEENEDGDPGDVIEQATEIYVVYEILKDVPYATGFVEPGEISNTQVFVKNNNGGEVKSNVTVDETLDDGDKIYVPTTARTLILELTHVTSENNTIGVFYANKFEDLGLLLSGLPVAEYNDPTHFSADVIVNPSYAEPFNNPSGYQTNGNDSKYKIKLGKSIATTNGTQFHDLSKSLEENKKSVPSIYSPAEKEKIMVNSSASESRIFEVPLHLLPGSDTRHFALRIANIRPSNTEILNQVVIRVIGYRV